MLLSWAPQRCHVDENNGLSTTTAVPLVAVALAPLAMHADSALPTQVDGARVRTGKRAGARCARHTVRYHFNNGDRIQQATAPRASSCARSYGLFSSRDKQYLTNVMLQQPQPQIFALAPRLFCFFAPASCTCPRERRQPPNPSDRETRVEHQRPSAAHRVFTASSLSSAHA
ncbi:hypothetical protein PSPO01_02897 [Paraphaeosphaeria sporulosa]